MILSKSIALSDAVDKSIAIPIAILRMEVSVIPTTISHGEKGSLSLAILDINNCNVMIWSGSMKLTAH